MRVPVSFQNERIDLDVPEDRLVGQWQGPVGRTADVTATVREALEAPRDYPPLRQAVVPGDRVTIAFDDQVPEAEAVLSAIVERLQSAGVESDAVTVLLTADSRRGSTVTAPDGASVVVHDPADRSQIAYLATTAAGRRVYLSRHLTDADFVLPVGRLGYDPVLGYRGPWGITFPGLSDQATLQAVRAESRDARPDRDRIGAALNESFEVNWLLGTQIQLALLPDASGLSQALAGLQTAVYAEGAQALDDAWSFQADSRAELVVVGIGRPSVPTGIDDLAEGLATASRLVQRGGKIIALSRAEGMVGAALRTLMDLDDPRNASAALRGHEVAPDFTAARLLARSVAWADVYLLSALGSDVVEDLSMIALDRPEEARRLVAAASSCTVVSRADLTRASVAGEGSS